MLKIKRLSVHIPSVQIQIAQMLKIALKQGHEVEVCEKLVAD